MLGIISTIYGINILALLWGIITIIFVLLAIAYYLFMKREFPHFRAPLLEDLRFGEEGAQRMNHVHIFNQPLQIFQEQVNRFIDEYNADNKSKSKANALGYVVAAITSAIGLVLALIT